MAILRKVVGDYRIFQNTVTYKVLIDGVIVEKEEPIRAYYVLGPGANPLQGESSIEEAEKSIMFYNSYYNQNYQYPKETKKKDLTYH